jgi:DNA-binding transcriptional LysR family regulator
MDTETLKLIVNVARQGGFASVARAQGVDPSSISRAIAGAELELGTRLFHRSTRTLALTEAGAAYVARIAPVVEELERARDEAANASTQVAGTLRLTASVAYGARRIAPLLKSFRTQHPQLKIELLLSDANLDLVAERIDLAIRLGTQFEGDMVVTKLHDTQYRVVASPAYVQKHRALKAPTDLSGHSCVLLALEGFRNEWQCMDAKGNVERVNVRGDVSVSSPLVQWQCARDGLGPALLANWLCDEAIAQGELIDLFPHHRVTATRFDTAVWLLYPSRSYVPQKVRAAVDFLKAAQANTLKPSKTTPQVPHKTRPT